MQSMSCISWRTLTLNVKKNEFISFGLFEKQSHIKRGRGPSGSVSNAIGLLGSFASSDTN